MTKVICCTLLFRVADLFTHKHSKNEEQVVIKFVDLLTINYDIVLSSVLFGYGNFICINKIDIIL